VTNDSAELNRLERLRDDLAFFASECLKIRTKDEKIEPLKLNAAQLFVHQRLEAQKKAKGWVRALILKGRQQGISTYVDARFYHRSSMRSGVNVYILSHEQTSSNTLFSIVDRYQRHNPIAPHAGTANVKELEFDKLDSSYAVATAGAKAGGRGKAISLFHGSEVAFWANAPDHFAASVQGVPLAANTEVILETTSAGSGGEFYERWQDAESGRGDYIAIFLPWWLSPEYSREPEEGFALENDADEGEMSEMEYAATFGLTLNQMCWRRNKIIELRDPQLFKREYPATAAEAWTAPPGHEPFIAPLWVLRARKRQGVEGHGPLILGVDPASNGGDRFSIAARRGLKVEWVKHRNRIDHMEGIAWVRSLIDECEPVRVNIDQGNIGATIITGLKSIGPHYAEIVRGVNFGGTSQAKLARPKVAGPKNRRAEMWSRLSDWLMLPEGVGIPDDGALQTDMTSCRRKPQLTNDVLLESKDDMKKRGVRSPDLADAVALTFAFNEFFDNYSEPAKVVPFGNIEGPAQKPVTGYYDPATLGETGWMG
jgi:hypothetical protein